MRAEGKVWLFYDSETDKETKPLAIVNAQILLLRFKSKDLHKILIWTPGWPEWQNLQTFLSSDQKYFAAAKPPPRHTVNDFSDKTKTITNISDSSKNNKVDSKFTQIIIGSTPPIEAVNYGYYHNDFNGDQLDLAEMKKVKPIKTDTITNAHSNTEDDRRLSIRHSFKLEIVLINKEGSFRTFSKNISGTGTLLEKPIPKSFLDKPFDLVIINRFENDPQKARLLFKASIVGDLTNPRRLMFIKVDPAMIVRLEALLTAYVYYQQAIKRQTG